MWFSGRPFIEQGRSKCFLHTGFTSNTQAFLPYVGNRRRDSTPLHIQLNQFNSVDVELLVQCFSPTETKVKTSIFRTEKKKRLLQRFLNVCRKTKTKVINPTNHNGRKARVQSIRIVGSNLLRGWKKLRVQGAIGFGFVPNWFKNWCEIF